MANYTLKIHERAHLGAKPYRCKWPGCKLECNQHSAITKHVRVMHFKLPKTLREMQEQGIVDNREPHDYIEVIQELL